MHCTGNVHGARPGSSGSPLLVSHIVSSPLSSQGNVWNQEPPQLGDSRPVMPPSQGVLSGQMMRNWCSRPSPSSLCWQFSRARFVFWNDSYWTCDDDDFDKLLFLYAHREASALANQFRFLHSTCLTNLKGSVGSILAKVSDMRISIPLDLSSRSFIPLPCFCWVAKPEGYLCPVVITLLGEVVTVICAPRPWTRPSAPSFRPSFTSKSKQTEQFTSCTSVSNSYSQYFSTQCPIVYYTWFTVSTLGVKSVFWNTHTIHVFLNTPPFTDLLARPSNRYPRHQSFP